MRTLVPLSLVVVALSAFASEIPLSEPVVGPAPRTQYLAAAASNGEDFVTLWIDHRAHPPSTYMTRVARDGRVLDGNGIRIATHAIATPSIVWSGDAYVLFYELESHLFVMRIDEDGKIIDGPRVLAENAQPSSALKTATHLVVAYRTPGEMRALFLTFDAQVVKDVKIADDPRATLPSIAWNGTQLAAAWISVTADDNPAFTALGARFDINGASAPQTLDTSAGARDVRLASDGDDFLLLLRDDNLLGYKTRALNGDLTTGGDAIVLPEAIYSDATLLWTGTHYVVVASRGAAVSALRLDRKGAALDPSATIIEHVTTIGSTPSPAAATNGSDLLVAWSSTPSTDGGDVYGAIVNASSFTRSARELLSRSAMRQFDAQTATNGRNILAIWREPAGLFARRISVSGRPLDAQPLRLTFNATAATVTARGDDYIVAWSEGDALVTRRIPSTGELRADGGSRFAGSFVFHLASASTSSTTLLIWYEGNTIKAARVNADATLIDSVPLAVADVRSINRLGVSPNATDFLVVWGANTTTFEGDSFPASVRAARVTRSLTLLDPNGIDVAASSAREGHPSVTWDGTTWVVVWHRRESNGDDEIRAGRVTVEGFALDCNFVDYGVTVLRDGTMPTIAWDGTRHHLAWMWTAMGDAPRAIYIATIREFGEDVEHARTLGDAEVFAAPVSLAPVTPGVIAAAYARIAHEPRYGGVTRAFVELAAGARKRAVR